MAIIPDNPELLFVDPVDAATDEGMIEECYWSMVQRHPYFVLDQSQTLNIYGEPINEPVYALFETSFPFQVLLKPEEQLLSKYGFDRKRDAVVVFSAKIMRTLAMLPKVGDRFDFVYLNQLGETVREHMELVEFAQSDFLRQQMIPYQLVGAAVRTQKRRAE